MSVPEKKPYFAQLQPLRSRMMEIHQRLPGETSVELKLLELIDSLEEAHYRATLESHFAEYSDSRPDIVNLFKVQKELETVAQALEAACAMRNSYYRW
ncbi:MAG: hypothetical protein KC800_17895 [Candidatus Eremiobacteraeota bacterium]|nr:hypothetical protein [Candidatus Eremiobacteraeota bacterium]